MLPSFSRRMGSQGPVRQSASWVGRRTGDSRAPRALAGLKGRLQPRRHWRVAAPRLASSGERCADAAAVAPRSTCSMVRRSPRALHASWAAAARARSASASSPSAEPAARCRASACCSRRKASAINTSGSCAPRRHPGCWSAVSACTSFSCEYSRALQRSLGRSRKVGHDQPVTVTSAVVTNRVVTETLRAWGLGHDHHSLK